MTDRPTTVYLGFGSNLGPRKATLESGIGHLAADPRFTLLRQAGMYATAAVGAKAGNEFLNTAVAGLWSEDGTALLDLCQHIEDAHERTRPYRDAPRTLDIDILCWDAPAVHTACLQIPHPRLRERAFVLVPLLELTPDAVCERDRKPLSLALTSEVFNQGIESYRLQEQATEAARV